MEKNITCTVKYTKAQLVIANYAKGTFETENVTLTGAYKTSEEILKAYNKNSTLLAGIVNSFEVIEEKRMMPETIFLALARKVEKRENGDYIYRTIKSNLYELSVYNTETGSLEFVNKSTKEELNKFTARKVFKEFETLAKSIVAVKLIDTIEQGYSIKTETFINNSKVSEE